MYKKGRFVFDRADGMNHPKENIINMLGSTLTRPQNTQHITQVQPKHITDVILIKNKEFLRHL